MENKVVKIFMWIDIISGTIGITALILIITLNLIAYTYETFVGFKTFHKFLRKYHKEMNKERMRKIKESDLIE